MKGSRRSQIDRYQSINTYTDRRRCGNVFVHWISIKSSNQEFWKGIKR